MNAPPIVTIITAVYNHERYLAQAIDSVLKQDYPHWELILWDDGSSDQSPVIAQSYAAKYPGKIKYFEHPHHSNRGQEATRNAALKKASGSLLALLDSDDFYEPQKLSLLVPCFRDAKIGLAYGRAEVLLESSGQRYASGITSEPSGFVFENLVWDNFLCAGAVIFRRSALHKGKSFDTRFKTMGEYPLWVKIAKNWNFAFVPHIVSVWREHGKNQGTLLNVKAKEELVQFCEDMVLNPDYSEFRPLLLQSLAKRRYDYAHQLYSAQDLSLARKFWLMVLKDGSASKNMRFKSSLMAGATFLGKSVNQKLFEIKRHFWEKTHPFAKEARDRQVSGPTKSLS
jgi:glycosyltransferase involved in cell wall biosynthesis